MSKTIIVSNRLPIRIETRDGVQEYLPSEGGLATGLGSVYKQNGNIWIGWPGLPAPSAEKEKEITRELTKNNMRPVFLTEAELRDYYLGFSNQTLWPAFHYFVHYIRFNQQLWEVYKAVNLKFAEAIIAQAEPDDLIWVHDYQLMLVPQLLREQLPQARIGFFQHIPFPSFEIFRMLPWRQELLNGVLGSDFLGFHTYDDVRHFLSSAHRLTQYSYRANRLDVNGRQVEVDSLPMGIDYDKFYQTARSEAVQEQTQNFRAAFGKQRMILSVDRLDYSKGIPDRLMAFERFLKEYPVYQGRVSIILVVVPSRDKVPSYQELKEEVDQLVGRINGTYAAPDWQPVHYFYRSFPLTELSAFYRLCDVAMITPLRDGMNLVCKEFIASKYDQKGVLILSEMAGAAKELSEAILINPRDEAAMVQALYEALTMSADEQEQRMVLMQGILKKYTIFNWVKLFSENLNRVKKEQGDIHGLALNDQNMAELLQRAQNAQKILLLLDYDGTLVPFFNDPKDSIADGELLDILDRLQQIPTVALTIISGRPAAFLDEQFEQLPLTLVAEHGIWKKEPGQNWELNLEELDDRWKKEARRIMEFYIDRTPGSFLEEKNHAMVWHYRRVEHDLAFLRSSEMASHLSHILQEYGIEVMHGNNIVEAKPASMNKGKMAVKLQKARQPELTMAFGDDKTDEYIFEALHDSAVTVKVGRASTHAHYSVANHQEVRSFLRKLAETLAP